MIKVVLAQVVLPSPPLHKSGMWALRIIVQLRMQPPHQMGGQLKLETKWVV